VRTGKKRPGRRLLAVVLAFALLAALPGPAGASGLTWGCDQANGYLNQQPFSFSGTVSGGVVTAVYAAVYQNGEACSAWTVADLTVGGGVYDWSVSVDTGLPEGAYELHTVAYNTYGEPYADEGVFDFNYDATGPYVAIQSVNPADPIAGQPFTVVAVAYDVSSNGYASGIQTVEFSVGSVYQAFHDQAWQGEPVEFTVDEAGTYTLTVWASDKAGNRNEVQQQIEITPATFTVTVTDGDVDQVYYYREEADESDTLSFTISGLPSSLQVSVGFGQLDQAGQFSATGTVYGGEILPGTWDDSASAWTFSTPILNDNDNDLLPVAVQVYAGEEVIGAALLSRSGTPPLADFVLVNLSPPEPVQVTPAFNTPQLDLRAINASKDLVFTVPGLGSISFPPTAESPINILALDANGVPKIAVLNEFLAITPTPDGFSAMVNTAPEALDFLADKQATIRFFGAKAKLSIPDGVYADVENYVEVAVTDNAGQPVSDISEYIDLENLELLEDGTLVMPVKHFTTFTVRQDTTPTVTTTDPADGVTGVPRNKTITVTFSEEVQAGDGGQGIALKDTAGNSVEITTSFSGSSLTIDPVNDLAYSVTYTVTIPAGAVRDAAGNSSEAYSFSFTTESRPVEDDEDDDDAGAEPQEPATPGTIGQDEVELTAADGEINVTVPESAVQVQLDAGETEITLALSAVEDPVNVTLPGAAVEALAAGEAELTIDSPWADLEIPAGSLPAGQEVTVSVTPVTAPPVLPPGVQVAGPVVDVEIQAGGADAALSARVTLVLAYDPAAVGDEAGLFVYRLNEDGSLTCLGGTVGDGRVAVDLSRLSEYAVLEFTGGFTDIATHWAERDILFAAARGIARGVSATDFEPERAVTRAEFAALVLRALGISEYHPAAPTFTDVAPGKWYYGVVEAAYREGLLKGIGAGKFDPHRTLTRQEMAVLMLRALAHAGAGGAAAEPGETAVLLAPFTDRAEIASWARDGVAGAVAAGIIKGNPDGSFAPLRETTRAAAVTVLGRMLRSAEII